MDQEIKAQFPETKAIIEEQLEEKGRKENISAEQVIFLFTWLEEQS